MYRELYWEWEKVGEQKRSNVDKEIKSTPNARKESVVAQGFSFFIYYPHEKWEDGCIHSAFCTNFCIEEKRSHFHYLKIGCSGLEFG